MGLVMVTGADGYLGCRLAIKYLHSSDESLLLWVRADSKEEFTTKSDLLTNKLGNENKRVKIVGGNLCHQDPFIHGENNSISKTDLSQITTIIHCAAVTRFNVEETVARSVNIEGSRKALQLAEQCPALKTFALVSSVYASGLRSGVIEEIPYDNSVGFANYYESSKSASENELLSQYSHLPFQIFRVSTIIADNEEGAVIQQNAFHNTLRLFYYGLLSLIPGKPETPLYFITGDYATNAIFQAIHNNNKGIYHVSHRRDESLTLEQLIDISFETFCQDAGFRTRRILKPLFSDADSFALLADGILSVNEGILGQAVSSVAPFSKQLFIDKDIRNEKLSAELNGVGYSAPDVRKFIAKTCSYLSNTKWGRNPANG